MKLPLPFATYQLDSVQASGRRLVNIYPEVVPDGEKTKVILKRSPGIRDWATAGTNGRGLHVFNDALYAASGSKLYRVASNGTPTELGDINGTGLVSMDHNVDSLVVVATPSAYYYNGAFGQITDPDFTSRGASKVTFLDNWMIFLEPDSGRQFAADFGQVLNFNALNFATAESNPDNTIDLLSNQSQLCQFGTASVELAYNSGSSGYPFVRLPSGGKLELGALCANSAACADNSFFWLASDRTVRRLSGITPVRVSTHAIEAVIEKFTTVADAYGFSFTLAGHVFYVLTFPTAARSFIFDITSGQWHERESYLQGRWAPISYAYCYGRHLVQDHATGRIGELRADHYAEWDKPQVASWTYPTIYASERYAFHDRLQVNCQKGVGLIVGQGSDPRLMLEVSDDGGMTFDFETSQSLGAIGEYNTVVAWDRLGQSDNRAYRCSVSDPVELTVIETNAYVRGGRL